MGTSAWGLDKEEWEQFDVTAEEQFQEKAVDKRDHLLPDGPGFDQKVS